MSNKKMETKEIINGLIGLILLLISFYTPFYVLNSYRPQLLSALFPNSATGVQVVILMLSTAVLVVVNMFIVKFINSNINKVWAKPLGIVAVAILSFIPALIIRGVDSSFNSLGIVYFICIIIASIAWISLTMIGTFLKIAKSR